MKITDDLIDGTIDRWPVSVMIDRDLGGVACGMHCAPYAGPNDEPTPDPIWDKCYAITDATIGMKPSRAIRKAIKMGFVPDDDEE